MIRWKEWRELKPFQWAGSRWLFLGEDEVGVEASWG